VLAGRWNRAQIFLHEANAVPGRANRWLARLADAVFITFPESAARLRLGWVELTGMPVRPEFVPGDAAGARESLGLDPDRDVLLVMGGSQGARAINDVVTQSLDALLSRHPGLQFIHLTGTKDFDTVAARHAQSSTKAFVKPFHHDMATVFRAATLAVSRAGASSIAECAAMRLPSVLIPYPHAADDHQRLNAGSLASAGGAEVIDSAEFSTPRLLDAVDKLMQPAVRRRMQDALAGWHKPVAAESVASLVLGRLGISASSHREESAGRSSTFSLPPNPQPATS
jgi:UDP-N-acetylglucosamine--N-acetylmuramyl-(pentapeptide) pyrophosphoryl-undecaprenol N-acetylglucosamine transferase